MAMIATLCSRSSMPEEHSIPIRAPCMASVAFMILPCSTIGVRSEAWRSHPTHIESTMCQCTSDWPLILSAQVSALSRGEVDRGSTMTF